MVKDKRYLDFLERIIVCINHADYESVKELSNLELEKLKGNKQKGKKIIDFVRKTKIKKEELPKEELLELIESYSEYILKNTNNNIKSIDDYFYEFI